MRQGWCYIDGLGQYNKCMYRHLLHHVDVRRATVVVLATSCIGCWQEIEYTGPRTTSARPVATETSSTPPAEEPPPLETKDASPDAAIAREPAGNPSVPPTETPEPPPLPPVGENSPSASERAATDAVVGDRYATPPATETPPSTPGTTLPQSSPASIPEGATEAPAAATTRTPDAGTISPEASGLATANTPAEPVTAATAPPAAKVETDPPPAALSTRRAAWLLGSRFSLAALANDRGVAAKNVPVWFQEADVAAKYLGTTLTPLPEPASSGENSPASRQVINYLVASGQRIGRDLSKQHSLQESALFEVALKSNILLLLYTPEGSAGNSIAAAISQAAPQAKLPPELWQPLVTALTTRAPLSDVRAAVRKLHVDVDQYLGHEAGQAGR
jgi:hypothetical protein